jgi:UDP-glucose 6-dehydrogenase
VFLPARAGIWRLERNIVRLGASTDFTRIKEADAVIICVPTPLSKNRELDISFIIETGRNIAPHLQKDTDSPIGKNVIRQRRRPSSGKSLVRS